MANRSIHNRIAKTLLPFVPMDKIDDTNRVTDEPVKWLGPSHRVTRHDLNPVKMDSMLVNRGDWQREMVRQVHIAVDKTQAGKTIEKVMEIYDNLGYIAGNRGSRKHRK